MPPTDAVNILLVDDRPENLTALEAVLDRPDYNLVQASSGKEALGHVLRTEFAVILLDVQMPEMDGFETAAMIRSRKLSEKVPIIFLTAIDPERRYLYRGYEAGAVDYLTKPLDAQILQSKVAVFVDLFRKNLEIRRQSELIRENEMREHVGRLAELELQSLRRYRNLADAIPHMVWKADEAGKLVYCNRVWTDYNPSGSWQEIIHPADLPLLLDTWDLAKKPSHRNFELVVRIRRGDGVYRWHLLRAVPEIEPRGHQISWLGTNTDIHDQKQIEESFAENARELARSNAELEQFAYVASHDLQEPLRMVASYAQLLERRYESVLDDKGRKFIAYIVDGATRMQLLISDLLTYSRAGKADLAFVPTDLNVQLEHTLKDLKDTIQAARAKVTHDPLPVLVANPTKMSQILMNLVSNAIKFRRQEPPRVHISAREDKNDWVISVRDNGIGIDSQYFSRIFVIFQRLHSRENYPGTGIGLAICKKIAERHRGDIWVESTPGQGSTFKFSISKKLGVTTTPESEARNAA